MEWGRGKAREPKEDDAGLGHVLVIFGLPHFHDGGEDQVNQLSDLAVERRSRVLICKGADQRQLDMHRQEAGLLTTSCHSAGSDIS